MESIQETFRQKKFDPVEKLIELYEQVEEDDELMEELLEGRPELLEFHDPLENKKVKHKILSDLAKFKLTEDANIIRFKALQAKTPEEEKEFEAPVIEYRKKALPDGRMIVSPVTIEVNVKEAQQS